MSWVWMECVLTMTAIKQMLIWAAVRTAGILLGHAAMLCLASGCMNPTQKLLSEVNKLKTEVGEGSRPSKICVIIGSSPPIKALSALSDPRQYFIAQNQFVTVILGEDRATLMHKEKSGSYALRSQVFVPSDYSPFFGDYMSERSAIGEKLAGSTSNESVVVCDAFLNPIAVEHPGWKNAYPTLLAKYGAPDETAFREWSVRHSVSPDATPVKRLQSAIDSIRARSGKTDDTIRVLVILRGLTQGVALSALNEPKNLYLSRHRFVTVVVGETDIALFYRSDSASYSLQGLSQGSKGMLDQFYQSTLSEREVLANHFTGLPIVPFETVVVCDLFLNPIESENLLRPDYPALLAKYGQYTQEEYEIWLRSQKSP